MELFISWAGRPSQTVAETLRTWIPNVLQYVKPWMSKADLDAGVRWGHELSRQLSSTHFGVICVTRHNQQAPWLAFEAGALSKAVDTARVCPYLFGMRREDLAAGPLTQFQSKLATQDDTLGLIKSINSASPGALPEAQVEKAFEKWWPDLNAVLERTAVDPAPAPRRAVDDMVAELLDLVRGLARSTEQAQTAAITRQALLRELTRRRLRASRFTMSAASEDALRALTETWLHERTKAKKPDEPDQTS